MVTTHRSRPMAATALALLALALVLAGCSGQFFASDRTLSSITATHAAALAPAKAYDHLYVRDGYGTSYQRLAVLDARSGKQIQNLPFGIAPADWSVLYVVDHERTATRVRALDWEKGEDSPPKRQARIEGAYELPSTGLAGTPAGLSPNGHWLVLTRPSRVQEAAAATSSGAWRSEFLVLETTLKGAPRAIALEGNFVFDAISNDGDSVYLIENLPPQEPTHYQVRLYDLRSNRLAEQPIADKTESSTMRGERLAAISSPDGQWLYSLYMNDGEGLFIHALNLDQRFAVCIDLPEVGGPSFETQMISGLDLTADGRTLYVANGAQGVVAEIDTSELKVRRSGEIALPKQRAGLLESLARWLMPAAEAKRLVLGGATLAPDNRTLYVLGETGVIAVNTGDLSLKGHYLAGTPIESVATSPDGARLYAASGEQNRIIQLEAGSGRQTGELAKGRRPWGILHVESTPTAD